MLDNVESGTVALRATSRRKPTPIFVDEVDARIAQMRTLLGMIEASAPRTPPTIEALERAGFVHAGPRPPREER